MLDVPEKQRYGGKEKTVFGDELDLFSFTNQGIIHCNNNNNNLSRVWSGPDLLLQSHEIISTVSFKHMKFFDSICWFPT